MPPRKFLVSLPHAPSRGYGSIEAVLVHAREHARDRLLHGCEAISWIGRLALQWRKPYTPQFTLKGAEVQDATAGSGEQAAHVLPGQLLIDGNPPWALASGERMKVAWLARFMVTSAVPASFNVADSAAEKAGLTEAFRAACERAWRRAAAGERELTSTYETFLADAGRAFLLAEHGKQDKRDVATSRGDVRTGDDRFIEGLVLRMYAMHGVTAREANRLFPLVAGTT